MERINPNTHGNSTHRIEKFNDSVGPRRNRHLYDTTTSKSVATLLNEVSTSTNNLTNFNDGSNNCKVNVVNTTFSGIQGFQSISSSALTRILVDAKGHLQVDRPVNYETLSLTGLAPLLVYGSSSTTSIDMIGYRNLVIAVKSLATAGLSTLQNIRVYYSLDDVNWILGEVVSQFEVPGAVPIEYNGMIRIENCGFRYIRFFAVGITASPTAYTITYSKSN